MNREELKQSIIKQVREMQSPIRAAMYRDAIPSKPSKSLYCDGRRFLIKEHELSFTIETVSLPNSEYFQVLFKDIDPPEPSNLSDVDLSGGNYERMVYEESIIFTKGVIKFSLNEYALQYKDGVFETAVIGLFPSSLNYDATRGQFENKESWVNDIVEEWCKYRFNKKVTYVDHQFDAPEYDWFLSSESITETERSVVHDIFANESRVDPVQSPMVNYVKALMEYQNHER